MKTHESAQIMTPNLKKKDMSSYANSENNFRRFTDAQSLNHELLSYSLMIFLIGIMKKKITCEEIKKTEKKKSQQNTNTHITICKICSQWEFDVLRREPKASAV